MTAITPPNLPVPPGAEADEWMIPTEFPEDVVRFLTWSRHDTDKIGVAVEGSQYGDGRVDRSIGPYDNKMTDYRDLTTTDARQLAAALIEAADELDQIAGTDSP